MSEKFMTHLNGIPLQDKKLREKVGFADIPQQSTLKGYIDTEVQDLKTELLGEGASDTADTIKKNAADINTIKTETLPDIKATLIGTDADTKDSNTIKGAKKYTDSKIASLDYSDTAVNKQFVTKVSQTNGIIEVTRSALGADDIPSITHEKISDFDTQVRVVKVDNATNADKADEATRATQDSSGNNIVNTYATKYELNSYKEEHSEDYTNSQIENLIDANKPEVDSNGGIISGDSGLKLDDIYLKYLKKMTFATPSIASFSLNSSTYLEVGKTFTLTSISHYESNKASIDGNLTLKRGSTTLKSDIIPASSTDTVIVSDSYRLTTNGSVTYTLSGSYKDEEDKSQTISSSRSVNWYWPHFYGSASTDSLTDVSGLDTSSITSANFTGSLEISNDADEYVYFVTIDDSLTVKSGGFDVPLTRSTVNLNINGVSTFYFVYRTNQLNAGTLTYVLS